MQIVNSRRSHLHLHRVLRFETPHVCFQIIFLKLSLTVDTWCISDLLLTYYHFKMDRAFTISIFQINCKLIFLKITQWRRRDPRPTPSLVFISQSQSVPAKKNSQHQGNFSSLRKKDIFQYHIVQPNSKKLILFFLVAILIPSSINESLSSIQ